MPVSAQVYSLNEIGGRKNNEDSIWPGIGEAVPNNRLFLVCDGVGGNSHGEVASAYACKYISDFILETVKADIDLTETLVEQARDFAMQQFRKYITKHPEAERMSTTLTMAYLKEDSVFLAWCGDSKIFLLRDGDVIFQSEDHSLVNELVKQGEITAEEALTHPQRNIITRSLQANPPYSAIQAVELNDVKESDFLLLCTDGVTETITPAKLKFILSSGENGDYLEQFQQYCQGKTKDNYSMHLVQLTEKNVDLPPTRPSVDERQSRFKKLLKIFSGN